MLFESEKMVKVAGEVHQVTALTGLTVLSSYTPLYVSLISYSGIVYPYYWLHSKIQTLTEHSLDHS